MTIILLAAFFSRLAADTPAPPAPPPRPPPLPLPGPMSICESLDGFAAAGGDNEEEEEEEEEEGSGGGLALECEGVAGVLTPAAEVEEGAGAGDEDDRCCGSDRSAPGTGGTPTAAAAEWLYLSMCEAAEWLWSDSMCEAPASLRR